MVDNARNDEQKTGPGKAGAPADPKGAQQATQDNDLSTGHSDGTDGGDDNSAKTSS